MMHCVLLTDVSGEFCSDGALSRSRSIKAEHLQQYCVQKGCLLHSVLCVYDMTMHY